MRSPFARGMTAFLCFATAVMFGAANSFGQAPPPVEIVSEQSSVVDSAGQVLREIMDTPGKGIPTSLLSNAEAIVIVPGMLKGGFVIGAKHGKGVVVIHDAQAGWQLPQFVSITGGSVGWQIGVQATDLILVFKTKRSVQGLMSGKFTIGADASAAAGPVGREASASTDATLKAEIYSYSRSRGIFAGVALDGSRLKIDGPATQMYYRTVAEAPAGQAMPLPASALRLMHEVNKYATPPVNPAAGPAVVQNPGEAVVVQPPVVVVQPQVPAPQANLLPLKQQLAAASQRLGGIVDERWRAYLALPTDVYGGERIPTPDSLSQALGRFQAVAANPSYAALTSRAEFRETFGLLEAMVCAMPRPAVALPPPPQSARPQPQPR